MALRSRRRRREQRSLLRFAWLLSAGGAIFLALYVLWNQESLLETLRETRPSSVIDLRENETPNLSRVLESVEQGESDTLVRLSPEQEGERQFGDEGFDVGSIQQEEIVPEGPGIERFADVSYWRGIVRDIREGTFETIGSVAEAVIDFGQNFSLRDVLDWIFAPDVLSVDERETIIPLQESRSANADSADIEEAIVRDSGSTQTYILDEERLVAIGNVPVNDEAVFSRSVEELVESARPAGKGIDVYAGLLHPNPDPKLIELTPDGVLPKIDTTGRSPWQVYKRPHLSGSNLPQVAVVVTNLGLSEFETSRSIHLPGEITLAFAPYARRLEDWVNSARAEGHEVLLTLPMEPKRYPESDPGPFGLLTSLDTEENIRRLRYNLSRTTGYIGVVNFLGDRFVLDAAAVEPVMQLLNRRGLVFVDTHPDRLSLASLSAVVLNMPHVSADVVIDQSLSQNQISKRMRDVLRLARSQSSAVMVIHPFPRIFDELDAWLANLGESGMEIVPVSALVLGFEES